MAKFIPDWKAVDRQEVRARYGILAGWTSIVTNIFITLIKAVFGVITGSVSLIADAIHSFSDIATSLVLVISFRISGKPSDDTHPFGHGRMEAVATVIISVLLMVAGVELFRTGISRLINPKPFYASWLVIGLVAGTVIVKEWLARFTHSLAKFSKSSAIQADFWHHRIDAISSVLVIIAFIGQRMGISSLDGIIGLLVALLIIYTAWHVAQSGVDDLLGKAPSPELVEQIKATARSFARVLNVHDLIIHQYGQRKILSLHIEVEDTLPLREAHALAEQVEEAINKKFDTHSTVHYDPVNTHDKSFLAIQSWMNTKVDEWQKPVSFHELKIEDGPGGRILSFQLCMESAMGDREIENIRHQFRKLLLKQFPELTAVSINIEPRYVA